MTGERRIAPAAAIDVPRRLPGGIWGAPALEAVAVWNNNGELLISTDPGQAPLENATTQARDVRPNIASRCTARGEMPWPQPWVVQVGVASTREPPQQPQGPVEVEFAITMQVESSSFEYTFGVPWNGQTSALYPLDFGLSQAIQLVAQQVQIRPVRVRQVDADPALAGFTTRLSWTWLLGLSAPPQVVQ